MKFVEESKEELLAKLAWFLRRTSYEERVVLHARMIQIHTAGKVAGEKWQRERDEKGKRPPKGWPKALRGNR